MGDVPLAVWLGSPGSHATSSVVQSVKPITQTPDSTPLASEELVTRLSPWFWVLAALPALGPLFLIKRYAVDFHYWDEWGPGWSGLFVRVHNHQFTLADLFVQNSEHRQVLPRLWLLLTNPLTHWNNITVLVMGWVGACVISIMVLLLTRRTVPQRGKIPAIWFLCNLLIFTPCQYEIWLWGIGIDQWMLTALMFFSFVIAGSALRPGIKVPTCLVLAAAAPFCFGNGILAWPLTGLLLFWPGAAELPRRIKRPAAAIWIVGCLLCVGGYFYHYSKPPPPADYHGHVGILDILLYNLTFMGGAFTNATNYPMILACATVGGLMLAMLIGAAAYFAWAWRSGRRESRLGRSHKS